MVQNVMVIISIFALNWNAVVEGVTAGVAASLILGIYSISKGAVHDLWCAFRLKRSLRRLSFGSGIDGISLSIANKVGIPFTVRKVSIMTEDCNFQLNPTGDVKSTTDAFRITRKMIRQMKSGDVKQIRLSSEIQHQMPNAEPTPQGFIEIHPFTEHKFILPPHLLGYFRSHVVGLKTTIEFKSSGNGIRIVKIESKDSVEQLSKTVERLRADIEGGSFNLVRAQFGLPPVHFPPTSPQNAALDPAQAS